MNILGINEGHMSSACLLKDGKIVAAVSEERFTRNKNEQGFPKNAVNYCLKAGNISKNEIDYVANASNELDPIFEEKNLPINNSTLCLIFFKRLLAPNKNFSSTG